MFTIALSNEKCKIKIVSIKDAAGLGPINKLIVSRKELDDSVWTSILTKTISSATDLTYTWYDIYPRSRRTYQYKFVTYSGTTVVGTVQYEIECNFDEIYITDKTTEYFLVLNADTDYDNKMSSAIIEPMNTRTPVFVSNAATDYYTGTVDALPLPLDSNGNFTSVGAQKYKETFISFLKNRKDKFIKFYEGEAWLVCISEPPKKNKSEAEGAASVKFTWTEIGDIPLCDADW